MAQLPLVTLFGARVDVTDYSKFEDVFHQKIGIKTSFNDFVFIPNPNNKASLAFFQRRYTTREGFY